MSDLLEHRNVPAGEKSAPFPSWKGAQGALGESGPSKSGQRRSRRPLRPALRGHKERIDFLRQNEWSGCPKVPPWAGKTQGAPCREVKSGPRVKGAAEDTADGRRCRRAAVAPQEKAVNSVKEGSIAMDESRSAGQLRAEGHRA